MSEQPGAPQIQHFNSNAEGLRHLDNVARTATANRDAAQYSADESEAYAMNNRIDQEAFAVEQEAHEAHLSSPEMQELNDIAQIQIWGTDGKTAGYINPVTREKLTAPIEGIVPKLRNNPNVSAEERESRAKAYEDDIVTLVDGEDQMQLCQAKLVMDLRMLDLGSSARMLARFVAKGMDASEAATKVKDIYAAKDAERRKVIKYEHIFTPEDYFKKIKHTQHKKPKSPEPPTAPTKKLETDDPKKKAADLREYKRLTTQLNDIRSTYARRSAGRERTVITNRKHFSEKSVAEARAKWENAKELKGKVVALEQKMALAAGVSKEDLDTYADYFEIGDRETLARYVFRERMLATGGYKEIPRKDRKDLEGTGASNNIVEIVPQTRAGRAARAFYKWWGRQEGKKLLSTATIKKSGVRIGAGILVGVPAAAAGSVLLGPIAGGALGAVAANKISKSIMMSQLSKKSRGEDYARRLHEDLLIQAHGDNGSFTHRLESQTKREIKNNRRRLLVGVGAAALGGLAGEIGASHFLAGSAEHHNLQHIKHHPVHHHRDEIHIDLHKDSIDPSLPGGGPFGK